MPTEGPQCFETEGAGSPPAGCLPRANSALRSSIAKYGSNSYYYAHAPLPAAEGDAKKIEGPGLVTGGPPTLLASLKEERSPLLSAHDAASLALAARPVPKATSLRTYTWCDYDRAVKVYVHLDSIRQGEEADGPFTSQQVAVEFASDRFAVAIERPSGLYILSINPTYSTIKPEECSISVNDSKISISLKKKDELTWFSLSK